jgi:hypothetical protein
LVGSYREGDRVRQRVIAKLAREEELDRGAVATDRGMVPAANLDALRADGIGYGIPERLRRSTANEALNRAGRYRRVARNLEANEIRTEGAKRILACRNLERAAGDARQRDAIVQHLQPKIEPGGVRDQLKTGARRYLKLRGATAEIDLNANDDLRELNGIQQVTIDLGGTRID